MLRQRRCGLAVARAAAARAAGSEAAARGVATEVARAVAGSAVGPVGSLPSEAELPAGGCARGNVCGVNTLECGVASTGKRSRFLPPRLPRLASSLR